MANVKKPHETITQQRRQQQPAAGKWVGKTTRSWKAIDLQRLYMTPEYTSTETAALLLNNKLRDGQVDNKSIMHRSTTDTTSPESDKETIVKSVIPLTAEKPAVSTIAHQNKSAQKCIPKKAQAVKIKKDTAKPRNGPTLPVNMEGKELPKGVTFRPSKKWQAQVYFHGASRYIGVFETQEEAVSAYNAARAYIAAVKKIKGTHKNPPEDFFKARDAGFKVPGQITAKEPCKST